ncbi:MAG: flagellin lysine-N-methylase [Oscillospiraceae bacterium]|nr:flagellin lysine-N-methylase [Oscillospiraceae bacterium]
MTYRYPSYCDTFRCIADQCTDNCCIGWEIDIDSETLAYYQSVPGAFGQRLGGHIADGCFILTENERCPFLNSRNLCDIYTELGEAHLCQICTDHPRYYEWFGSVKEGGIGLCCEEAARIILSEDMRLTEALIPDEDCGSCDPELYQLLLSARTLMTKQLQNGSIPFSICAMLDFAEELQSRIDNEQFTLPAFETVTKAETADIRGMLHIFQALEPIDANWRPYMQHCAELADVIPEPLPEDAPYLRRIAVYFLFRYFMKGVFDGEILSKVKLAAVSAWMISYLWRCGRYDASAYSFADMVQTAKNYSKEVEYSAENLEMLADAFYDAPCFRTSALFGAFGC